MTTPELAVHGADPLLPEGPPDWPPADAAIGDALREAFRSGTWGRYDGPHGRELVRRLQEMHDLPHAMTCCSGTFAVELALRGLRVGPGDEVIVAGYDFGGNFRCIEAVGATPVLADIDPDTWCLDVDSVERMLSPRVRAIIVSHLHGGLARMDRLCALAREQDVFVVEDACQTPGAMLDDRAVGSWGDLGILSFGGSKLLSAGRGGAIVTKHPEVLQRAKIFCERGNHAFPLSELQAAVLIPQLDRLAERNLLRRESARLLLEQCGDLDGLSPLRVEPHRGEASYYKLAWSFDPERVGCDRQRFIQAVQAEGVHLDAGFRGFARRSARRCRRPDQLPHSDAAARNTVLLHHPVLLESLETVRRVAKALTRVSRGLRQDGQGATRNRLGHS